MEKLLFLAHRIPYPPNKGDKIRSYHFLKYLAERYQIYLGTFIDDANDWQYTANVDALCAASFYQKLNPRNAKIKSLQGLLTGDALSLPYYQNAAMQAWVQTTVKTQGIKKILVFSSVMAQFVESFADSDLVVDFVDVDSDKWRQYAESKHGIARWVYGREAKYLLAYEQKIARLAKTSLFVSAQEAELFRQLAQVAGDKIQHVDNGVDTDYFSPDHTFSSPYQTDERVLVFTGAMDYWANVDAVVWFAEQVFPLLAQRYPQLKFYIVGGKPSKAVQALAVNTNITVTGGVVDVRPYIAHAAVSVAPLRIARGVQNKVLEAMAMGKAIVATSAAMEGIAYQTDLAITVSDSAVDFAEQLASLLAKPAVANGNREFVKAHFSWQHNVAKLAAFLQG